MSGSLNDIISSKNCLIEINRQLSSIDAKTKLVLIQTKNIARKTIKNTISKNIATKSTLVP